MHGMVIYEKFDKEHHQDAYLQETLFRFLDPTKSEGEGLAIRINCGSRQTDATLTVDAARDVAEWILRNIPPNGKDSKESHHVVA